MTAFTVHVQPAGAWLEADHPDQEHQLRLARTLAGLPPDYALGWCGGCEWYVRWPKRDVDRLHAFAHQHLGQDHLTDLLEGRACVDPDLVDGGEAYLRERMHMAKGQR